MPKTKEQLKSEIHLLQSQLDRLEREEKELETLTPRQKLAIYLHTQFCTYNHVDYCDWEYDPLSNFSGSAKQRYLKEANNLLREVDKLFVKQGSGL